MFFCIIIYYLLVNVHFFPLPFSFLPFLTLFVSHSCADFSASAPPTLLSEEGPYANMRPSLPDTAYLQWPELHFAAAKVRIMII